MEVDVKHPFVIMYSSLLLALLIVALWNKIRKKDMHAPLRPQAAGLQPSPGRGAPHSAGDGHQNRLDRHSEHEIYIVAADESLPEL